MNFSANANQDSFPESLRLSVMFVLALIGAGIMWHILRRTGQGLAVPQREEVGLRLGFLE